MKVIGWLSLIAAALIFGAAPLLAQEVTGTSRVLIMDADQNGKPIIYHKPDTKWAKNEFLKTGVDSREHESGFYKHRR